MDAPTRTLRDYLKVFFIGFAMGTADLVPGVSGGTMAFILGIYEELLDGIKSFNLTTLRLALAARLREALDLIPWRFLLALGLGILTAIFSLSSLLSYLLENEREYLYAFFFGLILASIIAVSMQISRWNLTTIIPLIIGAVLAYLLSGLAPSGADSHTTPVLFFSGMIAIMAMILPGISGSFILLLLGQYEFVLNAVKDFDLKTIFTVALGCVIGLMGFSRLLSWLLKHYHQPTIAALIGFMIGALRKIWPWQETTISNKVEEGSALAEHASEFTRAVLPESFFSAEVALALALAALGFLLVSFMDHLQSRQNPVIVGASRLLGWEARTEAAPVTES